MKYLIEEREVGASNGCEGCAFGGGYNCGFDSLPDFGWVMQCRAEQRADGRNVIFEVVQEEEQ